MAKQQDNRNAVIVLSIFVLVISVYFLPVWHMYASVFHHNDDVDRDTAQIIESRGFLAENHYITTKDGYILTVTRIINPHVTDRDSLRPILLQHGFQNNANVWLINSWGELTGDGQWVEDNNDGPIGNTLGFVLAVNGYDVWLANMRGNMYSLNHTQYASTDPEFWSFSIDEMVDYDLPAIIAYIQRETNKEQLSYIGHSQGTYMMFGLLATQPHYSNVIKPFIALSPVPFMGNSTSPLVRYGSYISSWLRTTRTSFLLWGRVQKFLGNLCDSSFVTRAICYRVLHACLGYQHEQFNYTRTGVYIANLPSGSSSWNAAHLLQIVSSNRPERYDYGDEDTNLARHLSPEPPPYDLSAINSTHVALIYTANDWLNHVDDVRRLKEHLKVKLLDDYQVPDESWNHMELVWALETGQLVNPRVLDILNKVHDNKNISNKISNKNSKNAQHVG